VARVPAYNRAMLHTLRALLAPALAERLTLVINHVLNGEAVATQRLRAHAGRCVAMQVGAWPSVLPPPPPLAWRITPAGLLEWCGDAPGLAPDLAVHLDAPNPALLLAKTLAGETPPVRIEGDAQLAGDVNWLLQNLRWDVAADLERLFGPTVAQPLHKVGSMVAAALRNAVGRASQTASQSASQTASQTASAAAGSGAPRAARDFSGTVEPQRSRGA
jgi:ubiquinone biosynthesis accessory factor UbiJ